MILQTYWHTKTISETLDELHSLDHGLPFEEVTKRLKEYGPNKLKEGKTDGFFIIFLRQFQSPLIYILFLACLIIFFMGENVDASIILILLIFNAVVGTVQEGKAQNTLLALKKFTETKATVLRAGQEMIISDSEIVPGDIIILQEGEKVPADARVMLISNLRIDESSLTGESEIVQKITEVINEKGLSTSDQKNMVFKGTYVVAGNGKAIAVATGTDTVIGKISQEIATIDTEIPLKANVRYLSRLVIISVGGLSLFLFIIGIILGNSAREMFATVISLSVSLIPEGLPIVITLVLATGVWRMSKRNALVKKLQAVEALGQAKIIAVDKTGTITKNEMVIQKLYVPGDKARDEGKFFEVTGSGYEPKGEISFAGKIIDLVKYPEILLLGKTAVLCANARVMFSEEEKVWQVSGDPTEAAMLVLGQKLGFSKDDLEQESPRIEEIPFDYNLKYHATVHDIEGKKLLTIIGAPEEILKLSDRIWRGDKDYLLSKEERENLETIFLSMSYEGLRVIALAISNNAPEALKPDDIKELTFIGFVGMKDALRAEVPIAMKRAFSAGIRVVMITGDHRATAEAIASEAGIYKSGDTILVGQEIDKLSNFQLSEKLELTSVFARVTPEHKLRIIKAYQARGEVVAMTGDGVNDAPSLVAADLGVAMGKIGTEVAKEASDIILLDDDFGSIISAVEEGRSIYKTLKKVILYLFSTGWGESLTIIGAILLGFPLPLLPAQIIWLNFVTDGFLDVGLAMEPKEEGLLGSKFIKTKKYIVDKPMIWRMFIMAVPMMIGTLILFRGYMNRDMTKAWTVSLTTLAVFQWFNAWNCRHESKSIFQMNPFSNKFLVGVVFIIVSLQMFIIYNPIMQSLFKTTTLTLIEWLIIISVATSIIWVEEIRKFFYRRRSKPVLREV